MSSLVIDCYKYALSNRILPNEELRRLSFDFALRLVFELLEAELSDDVENNELLVDVTEKVLDDGVDN